MGNGSNAGTSGAAVPLFCEQWMEKYAAEWNADTELRAALARIQFCSVIGYGFDGEDAPRGIITVKDGEAVSAGSYNQEEMNWDIRCTEAHWKKWIAKPPGMMGLGMAFSTGRMRFLVGDYGAMLRDPRMAGPFIKTFTVMGRV